MKDREMRGETYIEDAICKSCGGEHIFVQAEKRNSRTGKWEHLFECGDCGNESMDFKKDFYLENSFKNEVDI